MRRFHLRAVVLAIVTLAWNTSALSNERYIVVNGEFLGYEGIQLLDQFAGGRVPDNAYWVDWQTGAWGLEGNQEVLGYFNLLAGLESERSEASYDEVVATAPPASHFEEGRLTTRRLDGQACTYALVGDIPLKRCD